MLYRHRDTREAEIFIDHILKYLKPNPQEWILDLGCGKGRHSISMHSRGFKVVGIDLSQQNIAYAKHFENEQLRFERHDMRNTYREAHFGLVMNLFTSFGYFDRMEENLQVLRASHANLLPKGRLMIDYLNAPRVAQELIPIEKKEIDGVNFRIERSMEHSSIIKKIFVNDGSKELRFEEHVKALNKQDFKSLLTQSGFEIVDIFGDYALNQFNEDKSPRLILIARKKG